MIETAYPFAHFQTGNKDPIAKLSLGSRTRIFIIFENEFHIIYEIMQIKYKYRQIQTISKMLVDSE